MVNGDDFTINTGAILTINSDNQWSQNAAVIGNITIDSGTGGQVLIDGRDVWWIPYDAFGGTGTVPSLGTVGTPDVTRGGSNVGEFLGVWSALGVAPTAAGSAMPATGFIKLRNKSVTFADDDVLTFAGGTTITINSTTGGQRGWLSITGETATAITVPRVGKFQALGDWFELGLTNGTDSQTFQNPVGHYIHGIQVETGPGTGIYEWWPTSGTTRWGQNNRVGQDVRGKVCNCTSAGVIQIALRGAVNNGYKPPTGCRVRIPNILINTTNTSWVITYYASTSAWEFATSTAGEIELQYVASTLYTVSTATFTQAYAWTAKHCVFQNSFQVTECATAPIVDDCCVGIAVANDLPPFSFVTDFAGGLITNCVGLKYEGENNDTGWTFTDCDGFTVSNCKTMVFGDNTSTTLTRSASSYGMTLTRVTNSEFNSNTHIGGHLNVVGCVGVTVNDMIYADRLENTTTSTTAIYAVTFQGTTANCILDGFTYYEGLTNQHPRGGIVSFLNAYNCEVRNIGTPAAPLDGGTVNAMAVVANFGGNDIGNIVRRVYFFNVGNPIASLNSSSKGKCINVWGDAADTAAIAALNFEFRGGRMTGSTTGQTAIYGTHWAEHFNSATTGMLRIHCNEPTSYTASQCAITAGTPKFTSTGIAKLITVGDQITWYMPYKAYGHTSLASYTFTGTNAANHTLEYQIDTGSGMSAWKTLNTTNLTGETISPSAGFSLNVRATCAVAATTNALTYLTINTVTNATDQQIQVPLPGFDVELTGLQAGSEIRAYVGTNPSTAVELSGIESSGTSFTFNQSQAGNAGYIQIFSLSYLPITLPITYSAENISIPIQQSIDRQYLNP